MDALPHGSFKTMMQLHLPFSVRTAERLMAIARNPVLTKSDNLSLLPPSWAEAARQRQHRHDSHRSNRDVRR
jgi:hypothetical protein